MKMIKSIPALPVKSMSEAVVFYETKFGFSVPYHDQGFAKLTRDEIELHLWESSDENWKIRKDISTEPVISGAETFLAGTASCRIEVDSIQKIYEEYKQAGILYNPLTKIQQQPWGTLEFPTLDLCGNLITFFERYKK